MNIRNILCGVGSDLLVAFKYPKTKKSRGSKSGDLVGYDTTTNYVRQNI